MSDKACSFFGHRDFRITDELKEKLKAIIEDLIINHNATTFLFGGKSKFNDSCHLVVSEFKEIYPYVKRIAYTCRSEGCTLESERKELERRYSNFFNKEIHLLCVEEEFEHKTKYVSGKASYIERNRAMIDDSDYCVFYYDENYIPKNKRNSNKNAKCNKLKSGTALAFLYVKRKRKNLINLKFL